MGTRCTVHFKDADLSDEAIIYKHSDGEPEGDGGMATLLGRFLDRIKERWPHDTRFGDPSALAARFVFFLFSQGLGYPVAGVGVVLVDPSDIAYTYRLVCEAEDVLPSISWVRVR